MVVPVDVSPNRNGSSEEIETFERDGVVLGDGDPLENAERFPIVWSR